MEIKILDFTTRLPGPLASSILADLGADVTKVSFKGSPDPFETSEEEIAFQYWAKNFNGNKKTKAIAPKDPAEVDKLLSKVDAAIVPPSSFFREIAKRHKNVSFIEVIGGRGKQKYLHDLNALFLTKSFQIHLKAQENPGLPYLPFAGVVFAQQIALQTLAAIMNKGKENITPVYLDETSKNVLDKLWSEKLEESKNMRFLHNGRFPCYNIYKSSDDEFVAVAAVESRFWKEFCELFKLSLSEADRFDASGKTGQTLSEMFSKYKSDEIRDIIGERDICVNVFARN